MGNIVIDSKDVYRAKIENQFESEEFFADVFVQANAILNEIVNNNEVQKQDNGDKKYSRIGNNIIAFCANRGQGKTSAMLSFARSLDARKDDKQRFFVLNSIDPSALNKKESIVRVFISRLFYCVSEIIKDIPKENYTKATFIEKRRNLLELFQKCFDNVDYLNNVRKKDAAEDDLEYLSQLGDSGRLRENLCELVSHFLDFVSPDKGKNKPYLVITIDDADLALENIFKICEDIRNYFSIENTVILMAADMEQLTYSIQREYMVRHEELIHSSNNNKLEEYYRNSCCKMASCYVEKVFPIGHRIELPRFEGETIKKYENLKIKYLVQDDDIFMQNIYFDCENMQQQLLKMLYDRTSIIFIAENNTYHSFLPRTLRELTHFLRFLWKMECVSFEKVYGVPDNSSLQILRKNIDAVENYFFEHWCGSRLDEYDQKVFREIRRISDEGRERAIVRIVDKYYSVEFAETVPIFLQKDKFAELNIKIQTAFRLYYTIFNNKWYAYAYGNASEWARVIDYNTILLRHLSKIIKHLDVAIDSQNDEITYCMNDFKVNTDILRECGITQELLKESEWIQYFCKDIESRSGEIVSMTFDMFQFCITIFHMAYNNSKVEENKAMLGEGEVSDSSLFDSAKLEKVDNMVTESESSDNDRNRHFLRKVDDIEKIIWEIKNILANVDAYLVLCTEFKEYQNSKEQDNLHFLEDSYKRYWQKIVSITNTKYLGLKVDGNILVDRWSDMYISNPRFAKLAFIGNDQNKQSYKQSLRRWIYDYRKDLKSYFKRLVAGSREINYENLVEKSEQEWFLPLGIDIPDIDEFKSLKKEIDKLRDLYNWVRSSIVELEKEKNLQQKDIEEIVFDAQQQLNCISSSQGD